MSLEINPQPDEGEREPFESVSLQPHETISLHQRLDLGLAVVKSPLDPVSRGMHGEYCFVSHGHRPERLFDIGGGTAARYRTRLVSHSEGPSC